MASPMPGAGSTSASLAGRAFCWDLGAAFSNPASPGPAGTSPVRGSGRAWLAAAIRALVRFPGHRMSRPSLSRLFAEVCGWGPLTGDVVVPYGGACCPPFGA